MANLHSLQGYSLIAQFIAVASGMIDPISNSSLTVANLDTMGETHNHSFNQSIIPSLGSPDVLGVHLPED